MTQGARLTPKARRLVLEQLSRDRLADLTAAFELDVTDRRSSGAHVDAIVRKRSLDFRTVLEALKHDELQAACRALGLEATGREKAKLVERILGRNGEPEDAIAATGSAPEAAGSKSAGSEAPPASYRSEGVLKSALRRFVLDLAGGLRGRDAPIVFTKRLLQCFGWPEAGPPDAIVPASLAVAADGRRTSRDVALLWRERRVLIEVVQHDVMLDFAWKELLRACLQVDPVPQYVILTNQRDLHLYDLGRDREAPRLSIPLDDLPKYSEGFPFLAAKWVPGTTPKIINVSKVSREVAELVARLYRSLKEQHPQRERDVVQFSLQCILTMFAEDIGLLPQEYFTSLLYEGARERDVERRLRDLFRLMSTKDVPGPRVVAYFNGGLFTNPVTLPLGDTQLGALTKASEANWKYVDPHIFGSVFQGIMDDAERHKSGAHYTAHDDIMRVVGPTIVEPWRQRIREAKSLAELLDVRAELLKFRVLDPACGSGNFLYVAFRELYRLDTELLARIREFPSTQGHGKTRVTWGLGIQTSNFFGIDINPFAIELAKMTLNIAKKIAFDERRELAADLAGQVELDVDPSLPLDNLDRNIVCADALFAEWPDVDAVVGNPPFLGGTKLREELGAAYVSRLRNAFPEVHGKADYCAYWFRRTHDRLRHGGRAGLVGTQSIRLAKTREASLDYIVQNGGTITNAVSSRPWPGEAVVTVSMVNWVRGQASGPFKLEIGDQSLEQATILPHLQLQGDAAAVRPIQANSIGSIQGVQFGTTAFEVPPQRISEIVRDPAARRYLRPLAGASELLRGQAHTDPSYAIDMTACETESDAKKGGAAYEFVREHVLPFVARKAREATTEHYRKWLETWWRPRTPRARFFASTAEKKRLIVCSCHASRSIFVFISRAFLPTHSLQVFAFDDDYSFGVLQSSVHWLWAAMNGSRIKSDIRYLSPVWETFPWPQEPNTREVVAVASAARELRRVRDTLMKENAWSLRALHQAADVPGPHPLKEAQTALDEAVRAAYGMPPDQEATEFLLELNKLVAEDEAAGHQVQGPGLPRGLEPKDPRWTSDDCIEPPSS